MSRKSRRGEVESLFLEQVNQTPVSAGLLREVIDLHAALPSADRSDPGLRAACTYALLDRKGLAQHLHERQALGLSIDLRLIALARLNLTTDALRGWSEPGGRPGFASLHPDVLRVAAEAPLVADATGQAIFDPDRFQCRLLALSRTEGSA